MRQTKLILGIWVALFDILIIGITLVVFALFHHVFPRKSDSLNRQIVSVDTTPRPAPTLYIQEQPEITDQESTPTPSPSPTPAPGDFSATFPDYDTSIHFDALHSYQDNDKRIVIYTDKVGDATFYVADVWIRHFQQYQTAFANDSFGRGNAATVLQMAAQNNAIVAMSGDFCSARYSGFIVRNGTLYRDAVSNDVCVLYTDGVMETFYQREFDMETAIARGIYQSWSFGPKLLDNGEQPKSYSHSDISNRHPRAALGYYEPGHYCLVLIDGRQGDYSRGMTFEQMSRLFMSLGCVDAYNLDGGQTAVMVFQNEIVNRPYSGGRPVSDIVFF